KLPALEERIHVGIEIQRVLLYEAQRTESRNGFADGASLKQRRRLHRASTSDVSDAVRACVDLAILENGKRKSRNFALFHLGEDELVEIVLRTLRRKGCRRGKQSGERQ